MISNIHFYSPIPRITNIINSSRWWKFNLCAFNSFLIRIYILIYRRINNKILNNLFKINNKWVKLLFLKHGRIKWIWFMKIMIIKSKNNRDWNKKNKEENRGGAKLLLEIMRIKISKCQIIYIWTRLLCRMLN